MPSPPTAVYGGHSISRVISVFGVGYLIIITFGFIVFLSAILLAFYVCYRACASHHRRRSEPGDFDLPRFVFDFEEEEVEEGRRRNEGMSLGLDRSVINSYTKFRFEKLKASAAAAAAAEGVCAICLNEFKEEEMVRMMPDCAHYFHLVCIDEWLLLNGSCPVCRSSPLPSQLSTPLSEVVPLSQHRADRRSS